MSGYPGQGYRGQGYPGGGYQPPGHAPPAGLDRYGMPIGRAHGGRARGGFDVPTGAQAFGHGAPDGYTFEYSRCTGKRKALLIGVNYIGQKGELRGCINDVSNLRDFLMSRHGYRPEDMVILTDDQPSNGRGYPSRDNMLRAMQWLVKDARRDDALFLHFSGHGGQAADKDGDEDDGRDEVIYPVDFKRAGHIVDDQIHATVVRPLAAGVRLTAIFDCCHSGSAMDLPYVYSTKGALKEPDLAREAGQGLLSAAVAYARGDIAGVASSIFSVAKTALTGDNAYKKTMSTRTSSADVVMFSGSKDCQTSADAVIDREATGAMSHAFVSVLERNPDQSYLELLNSIRDILEGKYSQKPQLSCSHPIDVNMRFVM